jgi:glyoxalase family protein
VIKGIHHITAIASDAQKTVHFYSKLLGLRLVKKTVNQDDVETYHLFFGDKEGHPGMDLTFFIFQPAMQGRRGNGLVTMTSLSVPLGALEFWEKRFSDLNVKHGLMMERFGKKRILFFDEDEQQLELVEEDGDSSEVWTKEVSKENSIRNFHSATLSVISKAMIEPILTEVFGYTHIESEGHVRLYSVKNSDRAHFLEISESPSLEFGQNAAGTVHHIAFRAKDLEEQAEMRKQVVQLGLYPTDVIDRFYFKSVYFRIPAGILFEIATDGPGFTADESIEQLGEKLALPPFLEHERGMIESNLPSVYLE